MMTKSDARKAHPARSEAIEPAFAHVIGVMFCRFKHAIDNDGDVVEAAYDFWGATEALNIITIYLSNATHASLALQNERRKIADMIVEATGIDPILDKGLKLLQFTDGCLNWYKRYDEIQKEKRDGDKNSNVL